ncbi:MAG: Fe-S oxidoreductase, partial [Ignavibacteria bacterium]|nr:Fe-S oxidoreductase [Ignavibacteria bacterium]
MALKNIIFIIIFIVVFGFFAYSVNNLIKYLKVTKKKDDRFDNIPSRLKRVWSIAFAQTKLLRDPVAGVLHLLIFWGFVLFIFAVLETILQGFYSGFSLSFLGPIYTLITLVQDLFGLLVIVAIKLSLYRRFVKKVPRLVVDKHGMMDAAFILSLIMFIVIAMYGQNAAGFANNNMTFHEYEVRPVSAFISG